MLLVLICPSPPRLILFTENPSDPHRPSEPIDVMSMQPLARRQFIWNRQKLEDKCFVGWTPSEFYHEKLQSEF